MASWLTRSTAAAAAAVLSLALAACGSSDNASDADRVPMGTISSVTSEPSPEATEGSAEWDLAIGDDEHPQRFPSLDEALQHILDVLEPAA